MSVPGKEEDEGVAAGLSAMEAEFREIDEDGRWGAVYQVGLREQRWKRHLKAKFYLSEN